MKAKFLTVWGLTIGVTIGLLATAISPAWGQRAFDVRHDFWLWPSGDIVPQVMAHYFAHAYVRETNPACSVASMIPAAQPGGFNPFLRDWPSWGWRGRWVRNGGWNGVWVYFQAQLIPAAGWPLTTVTASAQGVCRSSADANSQFSVNPFGAGTPVTGRIRSFGTATAVLGAPPSWAEAYAFSTTQIWARGGWQMSSGGIRWSPSWRNSRVRGQAHAIETARMVLQDPIVFIVLDSLTADTLLAGTLLSITTEMGAGPDSGSFTWENGMVRIDVADCAASLEIDQTSPYVSPQGYLQLVVSDGVVTAATDSGIYDGLCPPLGTPVPVEFFVEDTITFDYDLGEFPGHDFLDVEIGAIGVGTPVGPCDPPTTVTVYKCPQYGPNPKLTFDAPVAGNYRIYSTTSTNADFDPNTWTIEATVWVPVGLNIWPDPAPAVAYKRYVVVHVCE